METLKVEEAASLIGVSENVLREMLKFGGQFAVLGFALKISKKNYKYIIYKDGVEAWVKAHKGEVK